ncbi:MAG: CooT family nickel-binding protein [Dehalococcoidales bacterium]|nr:CooT family nickel-binding protein [Dehalococcoidales bacterium]
MCLAKVFLNTRRDQAVLQDIARLRIQDGQAELETLSGETRMILGKVTEIDFMTSSIILDVTMNELNIV